MEQEKLNSFSKYIGEAFLKLVKNIPGLSFTNSNQPIYLNGKKFLAIVGVAGMNKGRILVEINEKLAQTMFEIVNESQPDDEDELYFYLAEFANVIGGNGLTSINNTYKGIELRLTPPVVFAGENLEFNTARTQAASMFYHAEHGAIRIEVGFEGV
jgi:CheY-specific phosphatase CheX